MIDAASDTKKNIVCRCSGTTQEQISKLVEHGIDDLESLSRATGACSGCGACDTDIMALLTRLSTCHAGKASQKLT